MSTAEPIAIFRSSAVRSPISRLCLRFTYAVIASSIRLPPTRIECATTIPDSEITAISVVPPPTSQIALPRGSEMGRPAPIAAARGSSINHACRAPAEMAASVTARRSTDVTPEGTQIMISGLKIRWRPWTLPMKWCSMPSVTTKSAITPSRIGRTTWIVSGARPTISSASFPTARIRVPSRFTATSEGSLMTIPSPLT